eukprot:343074_1
MSVDTELTITKIWIFRASLPISFLVAIMLLKRNYINKRKSVSPIGKYLNLWSSLTLYATPICIVIYLCERIPLICLYTSTLSLSSYLSPKIFLTFYQCSRLQYSFTNKAAISSQFAYPKYVYYALMYIG